MRSTGRLCTRREERADGGTFMRQAGFEPTTFGSASVRLRRHLRMRMDLAEREVAKHIPERVVIELSQLHDGQLQFPFLAQRRCDSGAEHFDGVHQLWTALRVETRSGDGRPAALWRHARDGTRVAGKEIIRCLFRCGRYLAEGADAHLQLRSRRHARRTRCPRRFERRARGSVAVARGRVSSATLAVSVSTWQDVMLLRRPAW